MKSMNRFDVYAHVELIDPPKYLLALWNKHRRDRQPYITLKQTCFIEDKDIPRVKELLDAYFVGREGAREINLVFDRAIPPAGGDILMLAAKDSTELSKLQSDIVSTLGDYRNYIEDRLESFEKNFTPHLTVAIGLGEEEKSSIFKKLQEVCPCEGIVKEVVLSVDDNLTKYGF